MIFWKFFINKNFQETKKECNQSDSNSRPPVNVLSAPSIHHFFFCQNYMLIKNDKSDKTPKINLFILKIYIYYILIGPVFTKFVASAENMILHFESFSFISWKSVTNSSFHTFFPLDKRGVYYRPVQICNFGYYVILSIGYASGFDHIFERSWKKNTGCL